MEQPKLKTYRIPQIRFSMIRERFVGSPIKRVSSSRDVVGFIHEQLDDRDREVFMSIYLDSKNKIMNIEVVSIGSLSTSVVHPREVFAGLVREQAAAAIFCHAHPSGNSDPSVEDLSCTRRLVEAGKLLGIRVLDHIIVGSGEDNYYSFADSGQLNPN